MMEETTEVAIEEFRKETRNELKGRKQKRQRGVFPLYTAALHSDHIRSRWKYADEQQLLGELNSLKKIFVSLHQRHKSELIKGNYVAAHEIVGQIHSLIAKFNQTANPPYPYVGISLLAYCIILPDYPRRLMEDHQNYPGIIPNELAPSLPDSLVSFCLVNGDEAGNIKKATKWHEQQWSQIFKELMKISPAGEDNDAI
jgi:hypothetical protein